MTSSETSFSAVLESQITQVTVYSNQARIQRNGIVELEGSEQELVIEDLPASLQTESLRVSGEGEVAVRIVGVRSERQFATEAVSPQAAQLEQQLEALQREQRELLDRRSTALLNQGFVQQLSEGLVKPLSRSLSRQKISTEETAALMGFMGDRHGEQASAILALETQQRQLERQIQVVEQKIRQLKTVRPRESQRVVVAIAVQASEESVPSGGGRFELTLSYMIGNANWKPIYDLSVAMAERGLTLDYLAEVQQTTGEDWTGVALTLSTAKPSLGALPPTLTPWYVDECRPRPTAKAMVMRKRSARSAPLGDLAEDELAKEMLAGAVMSDVPPSSAAAPKPAEVVTASANQLGAVVTFSVGGHSDIPSDGNPHKVMLVRDQYPAQWQHIAMPKRVSFAYLQAKVQNPNDGVTLLPGKANIFRDGMFVGKTELQNTAPGQEFCLDLGIDESIQVERELTERQVSKKLLGGQRLVTYGYRVKLTNLLEDWVELKLSEQLPVSQSEKIKVRLNQVTPKIELGELGLLEWQLRLKGGEQQVVNYQFLVEHPVDLPVIGLD